jgi:predicted DNA-binding transcriptional regulator YafY
MPKRPDTLETVLLALELLKRIPRTHSVTASQLHVQLPSELVRDLRTVQRQLEVLSRHFDIERDDSSRPYGYRWKQNAAGLSLPTLTEQESLLLALAEAQLRNLLPATLMKAMGGFFAQAQRQLDPINGSQRDREWLGKVRVVSETQPLLPPVIATGVFETVSNALYSNHWLALDYRNAAGRRSNAMVMPLGLAQQGPRLYLVCRFQGFGNERSLALHRIATAEMTAATFARPKDFDLAKYEDDGRFGFGEGNRIKLKFRIAKAAGRHLLESPLSNDQLVKESADNYHVTATVVETDQLRWWLRGFGDAVRVIAPRTLLHEKSANSASRATTNPDLGGG